jgi:hypothetical protein
MSAKSLKQQNKGVSEKTTKTNEIEDKDSDTNQSSQGSAGKLPVRAPSRLMMMIRMVNQIFLKIKMTINHRLWKRLKLLRNLEEHSMSKIYSQVRDTHLYIHRVPVESLDLTCLYVFLPTSTY